MEYRIFPPEEYLEGRVELPLSKSMVARAMVINALAGAPADTYGEQADDIRRLEALLHGNGGDCGASATAMRLMTAYYAARCTAPVTLTGDARLAERPIAPLVDALTSLGADIRYAAHEGHIPLLISPATLQGGTLAVDTSHSSQYATALALIAPTIAGGLVLELSDEPVSMPYLDMTLAMMRRAGIDARRQGLTVTIPEGGYTPLTRADIEHDWSAAAFWYELQALAAGEIRLSPLTADTLQGDSRAHRLYGMLGVTTEHGTDGTTLGCHPDIAPRLVEDMRDTPDLVPSLAVTCCLTGVPFELTGLQALRHKESDRVAALVGELEKTGVLLEQEGDTLRFQGRVHPISEMPRFDAHGDHRMAMALAPVALYIPGISICGAECVAKSYPGFWEQLQALGFTLKEV